MRKCDLCETENADEARFCMKCGRDMDKVERSDIPEEVTGSDTFTPLEDNEFSRLAPTRRLTREPVGDVASYKEAAAASAAAWEAEQEQASIQERAAEDKRAVQQQQQQAAAPGAAPAAPVTPPMPERAEVQQRDLHADFSEHKKFCVRCGMANPRDQRFCKNCGSALVESAAGGMADENYESAPPVQPDTIVTEKTTLADVSPSSAYTGADGQPAPRMKRARRSRNRTAPDFGVRELVLLIVAALFAALLVWLFLFGGFRALFDSKTKNIHKAGSVMQKLPGFQFGIGLTFASPQGDYGGDGQVLFDTPGNSALEIRSQGKVQGTLQIGAQTYSSSGTWATADPKTSTGDVLLMWKEASNVEGLPNAPAGSSADCFHYKYRMDPKLLLTVLGLAGQTDVGDAVMEVWIDTKSFQVMRETAQVFGALVNGNRTTVTFVMDLKATGTPNGIKAPVQP